MKVRLEIDKNLITVDSGTTILLAAKQFGIEIPTMCYLRGYDYNTSCMMCVVEDVNSGKLLPSCSAKVTEGMRVVTDNEKIRQFRKDTLDLLLSEHVGDCLAPCQRICPAFMNIPLMIRQIQKKDWNAAIRTIKADIPLPATLGRICPAPCEKGCTRHQYDNPVSICLLKRIVADIDLSSTPYIPDILSTSGKNVAIVGAGPAGLSAAYYLKIYGHSVTVFDCNEKPGGELYYSIPQERLPKDVLLAEIQIIRTMGVQFEMEKRLGEDITLSQLKDFHAVVLATGTINESLYSETELEKTARGLKVDRKTNMTNIEGVFAGGNVVSTSQMAIRAIGHGKNMALAIDQYLKKIPVLGRYFMFNSVMGRLLDNEAENFLSDSKNYDRVNPQSSLEGYSETEAVKEALRCFHCDCRKPVSCKLRQYAEEYGATQNRYKTDKRNKFSRFTQHNLVVFEPGKCLKCGICLQITSKAQEKFGFTFINRGFNVQIAIPFEEALEKGLQKVAQECAEACPTAAISLKEKSECQKNLND